MFYYFCSSRLFKFDSEARWFSVSIVSFFLFTCFPELFQLSWFTRPCQWGVHAVDFECESVWSFHSYARAGSCRLRPRRRFAALARTPHRGLWLCHGAGGTQTPHPCFSFVLPKDWNTFLLRFNDLDLCVSENETLKHLTNDTAAPESTVTSSQARTSTQSPQPLEDAGPLNISVAITLTLDPLKPFGGYSRNVTHLYSTILGHQIGLSGTGVAASSPGFLWPQLLPHRVLSVRFPSSDLLSLGVCPPFCWVWTNKVREEALLLHLHLLGCLVCSRCSVKACKWETGKKL